MFGEDLKIKTMKSQKKKSSQSPVLMTQQEINEMKNENEKLIKTIYTRIQKASPVNVKKKSGSSKKIVEKSSPLRITKIEMLAVKRTGKISAVVNKKIISKSREESIKDGGVKASGKSYPTITLN